MSALFLVLFIGLYNIIFAATNSNDSYPDFVFDQNRFADSPPIRTEYFPPGDCQIEEGCVDGSGERTVIRFITAIGNIGTETWHVGNPAYSDLAVWDNCHDHYHIDNYVEYDIFAANDDTETTVLAEGGKEGLCVLDGSAMPGYNGGMQEAAQFRNCSYQGIGIGRMDMYSNHIICQFVDITDLAAGEYVLRGHVNPNKIAPELNYDNNFARVNFNYTANAADYYVSQFTPNQSNIDAWNSAKNDVLTGWGTSYAGILGWYALYGYNVPLNLPNGVGGNLYGFDFEWCFSPGSCFKGTKFTEEISPGLPTKMTEFSITLNYDSAVYGKGYFYVEGDWRMVSTLGCVYPNVTTEFNVYFDNNAHLTQEIAIAGDQNTFVSFQERVFFQDWDCNAANDPFDYVEPVITQGPTKGPTIIYTTSEPTTLQPSVVVTEETIRTTVPPGNIVVDGAYRNWSVVGIILSVIVTVIAIK